MSLADDTTIDIVIGPTPHAKTTLIMVDGDAHADEDERLRKFVAKLKGYVGYIVGPDFAKDHPGVEPSEVLIGVVCHQAPNEQMLQVTEVLPRGRPELTIRVAVAHCAPSELPWFVRK